MLNKMQVIGNLGRDPESNTTQGGTCVVKFSIAATERRKDKDGNWTDHTEWISCVAFGKTAENITKYVRKGSQVYVEGKLQTRKWQDKNGQDRYTTEVLVNEIKFLGGRPQGERDERSASRSHGHQQEDSDPAPFDPDKLPF